jgi:anti-sigma factor RsiW
VDGELSELGAAYLDAHLGGCEECLTYAAEIAEIAGRLRFASLEPVKVPLFVPRKRRPHLRVQVAAAAVVVAAAVGSSFAVGQVLGSKGSEPSATVGTTISVANRGQAELFGTPRRLRPVRMPLAAVIAV